MSANTVTIAVQGMSCGHCVAAVREAVEGLTGVAGATVAIGSAELTLDAAAARDEVAAAAVRAIDDAGYTASVAGAPLAARSLPLHQG